MSVFAAVMTGKGTGAISTIQVLGNSAKAVIKKIFKPAGKKPATLKPGEILLGTIADGTETIDQVAIGCESADSFAINCHGNPLIVEMIMKLLQQHGATLITTEQMLHKILLAQKPENTISLEAKLAQPKAKTLEGTKIIANQIDGGLSRTATEWLQSYGLLTENINTISLNEITADAAEILKNSRTAKLIIDGCTAAIAGPPNTGKSTLLNYLAGRQKAIVTDIKGTTRDWVGAQCQIGPLSVELIDTAGLDEKPVPTPKDSIEKAAQQKSVQILEKADLVLLVLDNSSTGDQLDSALLEKITGKLVLAVLNKSDLPDRFDTTKLPESLTNVVKISAKFGTGIENLLKKIRQIFGVDDFDLQQPVCITARQENLLKQLKKAKSRSKAASIITKLLNGRLCV